MRRRKALIVARTLATRRKDIPTDLSALSRVGEFIATISGDQCSEFEPNTRIKRAIRADILRSSRLDR